MSSPENRVLPDQINVSSKLEANNFSFFRSTKRNTLEFRGQTKKRLRSGADIPFAAVDQRNSPSHDSLSNQHSPESQSTQNFSPDQVTNKSPLEELETHHLVPKWFAKEYLHLDNLVFSIKDPQKPLFKQSFLSPDKQKLIKKQLRHQTLRKWIRSPNNAVLIDPTSHVEHHQLELKNQIDSLILYKELAIFLFGESCLKLDKWEKNIELLILEEEQADITAQKKLALQKSQNIYNEKIAQKTQRRRRKTVTSQPKYGTSQTTKRQASARRQAMISADKQPVSKAELQDLAQKFNNFSLEQKSKKPRVQKPIYSMDDPLL